jgi:hypothetical protein
VASPEAIADGNGVLGQIFGSKDASRAVAAQAAEQTGIGSDVLKQMLPMVAAMAMGSLARGQQAGASSGGGIMDMLTGLLDQNKDGSAVDDVLGMASKFLKK